MNQLKFLYDNKFCVRKKLIIKFLSVKFKLLIFIANSNLKKYKKCFAHLNI